MLQTEFKTQLTPLANPVAHVADVQQIARQYVTSQVDERFVVSKPRFLPETNACWLLVQYQASGQNRPIGVGQIHIDMRTGYAIPLTAEEIRRMREKAALLAAQQHTEIPIDQQGCVLKEFARKQANRYLWDHLGMFYRVGDLNLIAGDSPLWQATIAFKQYERGPFSVGTIAVDAQSGIVVSLSQSEKERIAEVVHTFIGHQPSTTDPS